MYLRLLGILDDGSPRSPALAGDNRFPVLWRRGEDVTVEIRVVTNAGVPVDLSAATLTLTVRRRTGISDALLTKTGAQQLAIAQNVATFSFAASDSNTIQPGAYVYDVSLAQAGATRFIVGTSRFRLEPTTSPVF